MASYTSGGSWLRLKGGPVAPFTAFEYDFGPNGPEGDHGPELEDFLKRAGALMDTPAAPIVDESVARKSRKAQE